MKESLRPAENYDLREQVYQSIKRAIVHGAFKPGEKLSEVELADQLQVSRTPVREAIRQLAKTGLVSLMPRKGAFVTRPTQEDASQLCALREQLEAYTVMLVAQNPPEKGLVKFRKIFSAMDDSTSREEYLEADQQFHRFLYDHAGNRFLRDTLLNLLDLINLYRPYSLLDKHSISLLVSDHLKVIDALLGKESVQACDEMSSHIRHNHELMASALS